MMNWHKKKQALMSGTMHKTAPRVTFFSGSCHGVPQGVEVVRSQEKQEQPPIPLRLLEFISKVSSIPGGLRE